MDARLLQADTIVFDVGNVLLFFDPEKVCAALLPDDTREAMYKALFGPENRWGAFDIGLNDNETIARQIAQAAGFPHCWDQIIHILHHFHETMHPLPLYSLIPELKAMGKKIYALTNYPEPSFSLACQAFPAFGLMDGMVVSAREKLGKPDPAIFQLLMQRYQLVPAKTLFIDDLPGNIQAAKAAGLQTWHYSGEDKIFE